MKLLILSLFALIAFALAGCVTPDTAAVIVIPDDAPEFVVPEDGPAAPVEPAKPVKPSWSNCPGGFCRDCGCTGDVDECLAGNCPNSLPLPAAQDGESVRRFTPVRRVRGVLGGLRGRCFGGRCR